MMKQYQKIGIATLFTSVLLFLFFTFLFFFTFFFIKFLERHSISYFCKKNFKGHENLFFERSYLKKGDFIVEDLSLNFDKIDF